MSRRKDLEEVLEKFTEFHNWFCEVGQEHAINRIEFDDDLAGTITYPVEAVMVHLGKQIEDEEEKIAELYGNDQMHEAGFTEGQF